MSKFQFKHFSIQQKNNALKVGTDAMLLGAFVETENKAKCLDVGAGTGVLSLMVAQKNAKIEIKAVEIDALSAEECQLNFIKSKWKNRLFAINSDIFDLNIKENYDLIVVNPPFYTSTYCNNDKRKATAKHASYMDAERLVVKLEQFLSPSGHLWVIIPEESFLEWKNHFEKNEIRVKKKINIKSKPSKEPHRVIVSFGKTALVNNEEFTFVIRNEDNSYTDEYIELTKDFHSKDLTNV